MPIVASMGGIAGSQTLTLVIRAMALGQVGDANARWLVGKELAVPFSWFYWAGQWIPVTLVGMYYLRREGLSLRSIEAMPFWRSSWARRWRRRAAPPGPWAWAPCRSRPGP